jgi:hypothetical protein
MFGIVTMLIGAAFALNQEVNACKLYYPGITEQRALELSTRTYGCVPKVSKGQSLGQDRRRVQKGR